MYEVHCQPIFAIGDGGRTSILLLYYIILCLFYMRDCEI